MEDNFFLRDCVETLVHLQEKRFGDGDVSNRSVIGAFRKKAGLALARMKKKQFTIDKLSGFSFCGSGSYGRVWKDEWMKHCKTKDAKRTGKFKPQVASSKSRSMNTAGKIKSKILRKKMKLNINFDFKNNAHTKGNNNVYKCQFCDKEFKTSSSKGRHEKEHSQTFQCRMCNAEYKRKECLKDHINKMHLNTGERTCDRCSVKLIGKNAYFYHRRKCLQTKQAGI